MSLYKFVTIILLTHFSLFGQHCNYCDEKHMSEKEEVLFLEKEFTKLEPEDVKKKALKLLTNSNTSCRAIIKYFHQRGEIDHLKKELRLILTSKEKTFFEVLLYSIKHKGTITTKEEEINFIQDCIKDFKDTPSPFWRYLQKSHIKGISSEYPSFNECYALTLKTKSPDVHQLPILEALETFIQIDKKNINLYIEGIKSLKDEKKANFLLGYYLTALTPKSLTRFTRDQTSSLTQAYHGILPTKKRCIQEKKFLNSFKRFEEVLFGNLLIPSPKLIKSEEWALIYSLHYVKFELFDVKRKVLDKNLVSNVEKVMKSISLLTSDQINQVQKDSSFLWKCRIFLSDKFIHNFNEETVIVMKMLTGKTS